MDEIVKVQKGQLISIMQSVETINKSLRQVCLSAGEKDVNTVLATLNHILPLCGQSIKSISATIDAICDSNGISPVQ